MRAIILGIVPVVVVLTSCSSALVVESTPDGADVFVRKENEVSHKLGKTPMTITKDNAPWLFTQNVELIANKAGYQTERILIPQARSGVRSRWDISFQPGLDGGTGSNNLYAELAEGIADAQKEIYLKNFPQAKTRLEMLLTKYQNISVLYDLLGNVYYLQKELDKAIEMYRKSAAINPNNPETAKMVDKISRITNDRKGG